MTYDEVLNELATLPNYPNVAQILAKIDDEMAQAIASEEKAIIHDALCDTRVTRLIFANLNADTRTDIWPVFMAVLKAECADFVLYKVHTRQEWQRTNAIWENHEKQMQKFGFVRAQE